MRKRTATGARVNAERQPRLAALVAEEARTAAAEPPDAICATLALDAGVVRARRGGRTLTLGLPMLGLVSERGLRAVVGHELATGAGGDVYTATRRRLEAHSPAWDAYWLERVMPALEAGRRPPVLDGFAAFLRAEPVESEAVEDPDDTPPAVELLAEIPELEQDALAAIWTPPLEPMAWSEFGDVYLVRARRNMADFPSSSPG